MNLIKTLSVYLFFSSASFANLVIYQQTYSEKSLYYISNTGNTLKVDSNFNLKGYDYKIISSDVVLKKSGYAYSDSLLYFDKSTQSLKPVKGLNPNNGTIIGGN